MSYPREAKVENKWWLKLWVKDVLSGSLLTDGGLEDLGFFTAMCCLAADCRGTYSWIQANPETPFKHTFIAGRLGIDIDTFERLFTKMIKEERMIETETGIQIINYEYYQKQKGVKKEVGEDAKPLDAQKTTWDKEHKEQRDKAMAYKSGFSHPEDAIAGAKAREFEDSVKDKIKNGRQEIKYSDAKGECNV